MLMSTMGIVKDFLGRIIYDQTTSSNRKFPRANFKFEIRFADVYEQESITLIVSIYIK